MDGTAPAPGHDSRQVDWLKHERDRFVAFAFCSADLLVEVDTSMSIVFAAGASGALLGARPETLVGTPLIELIDPGDGPMVSEMVWAMREGTRVGPATFRLRSEGAERKSCRMSGYRLPDLPGAYFFAIREPQAAGSVADESERDPETGLLESDTFTRLASERLQRARSTGEDLNMTLLHLPEIDTLWSKLDEEAAGSLAQTLGACLRVSAGSEQIAGRFDDENFGIVHGSDVDIDAVQSRMQAHIKKADPDGIGVPVSTGTVSGAVFEGNDADAVKALAHTINQFCQTSGAELTTENFSSTVERLAQDSSKRLATFRSLVSSQNFEAAFHPIVNIQDMRIQHYEALVRFGGEVEASPYELIEFAENAGLIANFDLAMARKVLMFLRDMLKRHEFFEVSVNISGRSIGDPGFRSALRDMLKEFGDVRRQLMMEITESFRIDDLMVVNNFVQEMRAAGHTVCLDDFGAGSSAMGYISAIDVDVVKIDGEYIAEALRSQKQLTLLRHIAAMCTELGIATVAERVEHSSTLDTLRRCGIGFAQGFLFGRPNRNIMSFGEKRRGDPSRHITILG